MVSFSFLAWGSTLLAVELGGLRKALYKIRVVSQEPDYKQPWNYQANKASSGTGFYIGEAGILTNAHVVANAKFISIQKDGDDQPVSARVKFIAHDCDLALLEVQDADFFRGVTPFTFGDVPEVRETVNTVGYPLGGEQLSFTQGVVSRVGYRRYVHSGAASHLLVQVDSAINPGNSGGPVLQGKTAVGVAFQSNAGAENTGYIIPTPVVKRFLKDIIDGVYDGHPVQGFLVQDDALENAATRKFHGVKKGEGGVKINEIASYSPLNGKVEAGDILLAIDGKPIGIDGKVSFLGERLNFRVIYDLKQRGDRLKFSVLRSGQRFGAEVELNAKQGFYDPAHQYINQLRFLKFAGLVFTPLSREYLESFGRNWLNEAPLVLRYVHSNSSELHEFENVHEPIVLSERLPNAVNNYAGPFMDQILRAVNGQSVRSLDDLARVLTELKDDFVIFEFWMNQVPLVLGHEEAQIADTEISKKYSIPITRWLAKPTDGATANWELEK